MDEDTKIVTAPTTKIKIVALWLVLIGTLGAVITVISVYGAFMFSLNGGTPNPYSPLIAITLMASAVCFAVATFLGFKISSGLHALEYYAYQSASLFFAVVGIGALVNAIVIFIISGQVSTFIGGILSALLNGMFYLLLHSERHQFKNKTTGAWLKTFTLLTLVTSFWAIPIVISAPFVIAGMRFSS